MKIIFFGASRFVIPLIEMLDTFFELAIVVTTEQDPHDTVPSHCTEQAIPFISVKTLDQETLAKINAVHADIAVLAYFGVLLPQNILDMFPHGILNIHPSLLPQYRGATPVQSAILNGDKTTGVTIIKLDNLMDHGPILAHTTEAIADTDTKETLHDRLFAKGTEMLKELIPQYIAGDITLQEQEHEKATFTARALTKQDGYIEANNPPTPEELDLRIRAYYPWPGVWTRLRLKASDGQAKEKIVKLLPGKQLQVEGKKPMSIKDFLNGYPQLKDQLGKLFAAMS